MGHIPAPTCALFSTCNFQAIASVFNSDEEFKNALGDPLYGRIRDALCHTEEQNMKLEDKGSKNDATGDLQKIRLVKVIQEHTEETSEDISAVKAVHEGIEETKKETEEEIHMDQNKVEFTSHGMIAHNTTTICEIEEEGIEESRKKQRSRDMNSRKVYISPEVEDALGTLEKVIAMVRKHGWNAHNRSSSSDKETKYHEEAEKEKSTPADERTSIWDQAATEVLNKEAGERCLDEPGDSSSGHSLR